ncbi:MAG: AsnC family transcriptional regulator [Barnesiella sp.]|nr:AsnC family transcriptional regulator [Bacteroidales bacterium]MBD5246351.1 AsnC family transcriptional regulator [Barnesiella sp.]MBD5249227.1 AsnC family transcriptional regulator [Barnesiella sp.]
MIQELDSLDVNILQLLSDNARKPYLEVARETGVSGAAIHQRVAKLQQMGVIKGSETLVSPESIGYDTCAYLGVYVKDPQSFDNLLEKLKDIPEVVECHLTTGQYDMLIKVYAKNNTDLYDIIHNKFHSLNLGRTETIISFKELFKRQLPIKETIKK